MKPLLLTGLLALPALLSLTLNCPRAMAGAAVVDEASIYDFHAVPSNFRFQGEYAVSSRAKVNGEERIEMPISPLRFHLFTDGEEIRVYLASKPKKHSSFQVYRRDGVQVLKQEGEVQELVPGLQAQSMKGKKLRHLCVTQDFFQLTEFPGNSDQLTITRATRLQAPQS